MSDTTDKLGPRPILPARPERVLDTPDALAPTSSAAPKITTEAMMRDARLKAALKANMARRKGQARARAGAEPVRSDNDKNT